MREREGRGGEGIRVKEGREGWMEGARKGVKVEESQIGRQVGRQAGRNEMP